MTVDHSGEVDKSRVEEFFSGDPEVVAIYGKNGRNPVACELDPNSDEIREQLKKGRVITKDTAGWR